MKKLFLMIISFLLMTSFAYCGSLGNTFLSDKTDSLIAVTTEGNYIFDSDLDAKVTGVSDYEIDNAIFLYEKIAYVGWERIRPYIKLGVGSIEANFIGTGTKYDYETEMAFSYGAGVEGTIYSFENSGINLFGNILYEYLKADIDELKEDGVKTAVSSDEIQMEKYQIALGINKVIELNGGNTLIPYIGVKYQILDLNTKFESATTSSDYNSEAEDEIGVFLGCIYEVNDTISLGLEGNFIDETAISGSVVIKF